MPIQSTHLLETLEMWRLAGGSWRIVSISDEHAVVDRCAYTGEPLERLESHDPAVISWLRDTHPFADRADQQRNNK
jgi:hypothetical protein